MGIEPTVSCVTGRCPNQLDHTTNIEKYILESNQYLTYSVINQPIIKSIINHHILGTFCVFYLILEKMSEIYETFKIFFVRLL